MELVVQSNWTWNWIFTSRVPAPLLKTKGSAQNAKSMRQTLLADLPQSHSLQEINRFPQDRVNNLCVICSREMAPVHVVPSVFCGGVGKNMWRCDLVTPFGPHGECSEQSGNMWDAGNSRKFSKRSSSTWVNNGNVNLFSYQVVHVETDTLALLGKCMPVCSFLMDCAVWVVGWTKPISTSSSGPTPDGLGWGVFNVV